MDGNISGQRIFCKSLLYYRYMVLDVETVEEQRYFPNEE